MFHKTSCLSFKMTYEQINDKCPICSQTSNYIQGNDEDYKHMKGWVDPYYNKIVNLPKSYVTKHV